MLLLPAGVAGGVGGVVGWAERLSKYGPLFVGVGMLSFRGFDRLARYASVLAGAGGNGSAGPGAATGGVPALLLLVVEVEYEGGGICFPLRLSRKLEPHPERLS